MKLETRQIGIDDNRIIELTVTDWSGNNSITEDVTNLNGVIDQEFIDSLRELADELEESNNELKTN